MLSEILRAEIESNGPMLFRDFMAAALYHPQHGYYTTGRAKIGRSGDYFTSVSVGSLFGKLLAHQFAEVWELLGRPAPFDLVEQGAHDGTLAADILGAMPASCPVRLTIVEPSAHWAERQRERLAGFNVRWVKSVDELEPFVGIHYSNELLDAFPVHLVHRSGGTWKERAVRVEGSGFGWDDLPLSQERLQARLPERSDGYITEVNLAAEDWVRQLAPKLVRGMILVIDYGYAREEFFAPHRTAGTLQAIANHQRVDPLAAPGEADLTAHIDFTAVAEASGLDLLGYADQHHFLVGLSRLHFQDGVRPSPQETRAFQTLAHPTMLGRAFKALALGRGMQGALSGFSFAPDPRAALGLAGEAEIRG